MDEPMNDNMPERFEHYEGISGKMTILEGVSVGALALVKQKKRRGYMALMPSLKTAVFELPVDYETALACIKEIEVSVDWGLLQAAILRSGGDFKMPDSVTQIVGRLLEQHIGQVVDLTSKKIQSQLAEAAVTLHDGGTP